MGQFKNVSLWFAGLLALVVAGFWETYFGRLFRGWDFAHHFHALVMIAWVLLLILQPWLIRTKRLFLHRVFGRIGIGVAVLVVISGVQVALFGLGSGVSEIGARGFYFSMFLSLNFALMATLAFITRHNYQLHARYMIATSLVFVVPSLGRFAFFILEPLGFPALPLLVVQSVPAMLAVALVVWDKFTDKFRFPFILASVLWLAHIAIMSQIAEWDWWIDFANTLAPDS